MLASIPVRTLNPIRSRRGTPRFSLFGKCSNAAQAKATAADTHARAARTPVKTGWGGLDSNGHAFLERKPGKDLTFFTPGGEITAYGQFDVSLDAATKNIKSGPVAPQDGGTPAGNFGWMPDI